MGNLVKSVIAGDQEAFQEWMDLHIHTIERFAIQYGVALQDAGKVAENVFGNLYNSLGQLTEEQLEDKTLYKTALQLLSELPVEESNTGLFPFQEDNELHARLLYLPKEERIAFILSRFHEKYIVDIAWIMEKKLIQVNDLLQEAQAKLASPNIDKRCELLNKSYQRLRPSFDDRNIFYSKPTEAVQDDEHVIKMSWPKWRLYHWIVGSTVLILLLSVTVLRSDAYQQSSSEKFIDSLKSSFQQELDDRFELIGLTDTKKGMSSYTVITHGYEYDVTEEEFGFETKYFFNSLIRDFESGSINKKDAKKKYNELVLDLRLPSEMVDNLQKNSLTNDRERSLAFLEEFSMKNRYLASSYQEILALNSETVMSSEFYEDSIVDVEKLLLHKSTLPTELQKAIDGMATQYFALTSIENFAPITTKYGSLELEEVLMNSLHPDMQIYNSLLLGKFGYVHTATFDELLEALRELEKELPKTRESDQLVYLFDSTYLWTFVTAAGFNHESGIYDPSSVVRREIRDRWSRIASNSDMSPSGQVIQQIIDEMETSDWTSSPYYEELMSNGVWMGLYGKMKEIRTTEDD